MKNKLLSLLLIVLTSTGFAQQNELSDFNKQRRQINKTAFKILGGFSAANIIYGTIASSQTSGSTKYFHEMNAIWNGVTLGILAIGHFTEKKEGDLSFIESLKKQHGVEKTFLFNAGLDIAYIAGGAYLYEKSKSTIKKPERLKGYGQSLMMQGGALLLFDGIMYVIHNRHGEKLNGFAEKVQFTGAGNGIGFAIKL